MSFWTVGDAGPYKENGNFLMRRSLFTVLFVLYKGYEKDIFVVP